MKIREMLVAGLWLGGPFIALQSALAQGSLTPPGAPAPTMKTLSQIEPRTPISSLPFAITAPGSYYATSNLTGVSGQNGITVSANNVTIDLSGFNLAGVAGSSNGVYVSANVTNLAVRHGNISGWGLLGVNANTAYNAQFGDLRVSGCGTDGMDVGFFNLISRCQVVSNGHEGFFGNCTACTFENCVASQNVGWGIVTYDRCELLNCSADNNGQDGFNLYPNCILRDCTATDNGGTGIYCPYTSCQFIHCDCCSNTSTGISAGLGCALESCTANSNGNDGIMTLDNCTLRGCSASQNSPSGISTGNNCTAENCTASANSQFGLFTGNNCTLTGCTISGNQSNNVTTGAGCSLSLCSAGTSTGGHGFALGVGNTAIGCTAYSNGSNGFDAGDRDLLQNCGATFNSYAGIHINYLGTVEHCKCGNNGYYGILSDTAGYGSILQNDCSFNGLTGFSGTPSHGAGIYVTNSVEFTIDGNVANINWIGINVASNNNALIVRNSVSGSISTAYSFGTGNSWGPIVTVTGVGDISTTANANQPTANFVH